MEPSMPIRQSPRGYKAHRLSFLYSCTMAMCLCVAALGVPTAGVCASIPTQLPLLEEAPSDVPPAIAQAFPPPQMSKRWVRRHRTMGLNPVAVEAMRRTRKETKPDITLDLFDAGTRTLELDEPEIHRNKAKVWRGRLRGEKESDVTLIVRGTKMVGTILSNQRLYKIEPAEDNRHRLVEIDEDALPPDHHPIAVPDDGTPADPPAPDPGFQPPDAIAPGYHVRYNEMAPRPWCRGRSRGSPIQAYSSPCGAGRPLRSDCLG